MTSAAPLPFFGQIAPKMYAHLVRWSCGARGRVPRFAQRRVMEFFWPDAGLVLPPQFYLGSGGEAFADLVQFGRKSFFLKSSMARPFCA